MMQNRLLLWWLSPIAIVCAVIGSSGCSEELGPERMPVTSVKGFVKESVQPVKGGWIEFFPVQGTVGNLCSARIRSDGSFEARDVAVGLNLIRLVNVPLGSAGAKQIFGAYTSPIRRTIPAEPTEPIVIDIVDEAIRWRALQPERGGDSRGAGESR